ncbi:MAG: GntR family transcriptional regulator [Christensenellaceae bacterium]
MEIRLQGKQNVYQNIVEEYKRLIGFGAMKYGERLPSVRALALELGVNPNTVERAYSALEEQGVYPYFAEEGRVRRFCGRRAALSAGGAETSASAFKQAGFTEAEFLMLLGEIFSGREEEKRQ